LQVIWDKWPDIVSREKESRVPVLDDPAHEVAEFPALHLSQRFALEALALVLKQGLLHLSHG